MKTKEVDYNDVDELRKVLVGRRIIATRHGETTEGYNPGLENIQFVLDSGVILEVQEAEGGCGCTNGDWSVENPEAAPTSVITGVEVVDEPAKYGDYTSDEEATLRMFVYTDAIKTELVRSEGGDNGYYGWGYHVLVKMPEVDA